MTTYEIHRQQWLAYPLNRVFAFFSRAENLEQLTPAFLRFRIVRRPPRMEPGARIVYKLRIHGIPVRWVTDIETWQPPHEFVDVQIKGPYKLWRHTHRFREENGGTLIEDTVRYALPFHFVGALVNRLLVAQDVRRIFDYRERVVARLFP